MPGFGLVVFGRGEGGLLVDHSVHGDEGGPGVDLWYGEEAELAVARLGPGETKIVFFLVAAPGDLDGGDAAFDQGVEDGKDKVGRDGADWNEGHGLIDRAQGSHGRLHFGEKATITPDFDVLAAYGVADPADAIEVGDAFFVGGGPPDVTGFVVGW